MVVFTIRAAGVDDLAGIMLLQSTCLQVVDWSEGLWTHLLKESVNGGSLRRVWVAEADGTVVGFLAQAGVAGIADLEMVVVSGAVRGEGIGRALCVQAMLWAQERGATSMELEVRASNEVALRLYESLGFERQGVRREYYRDPVEDAVLMSAML
ncbi:ribosomal-protein-alanine N-acetyltransferase [Granulicella sp. 5B5]|uniref:ribosomal protein S18-alanine N-acetyltransferase n=1 Tax=Granulicella sp. 5B5 TaxID=1617967 RepID=UPI001769317B|nr:ribosomal protein S18-alanine N-acetyltransferase [Granulicella sp. 5B5]QMV19983.1 ribosomal-protein-alanine N-acetyltransferase [Granulicella sp. 5B5]